MKRTITTLAIATLTLLMIGMSFAQGTTRSITTQFNSVNLEVNGENVNADTLLFEGVTYVPLRAAAEMLDKKVSYNSITRTASIDGKQEASQVIQTNMISNHSVEEFGDNNLPRNWKTGFWGEGVSCEFSYFTFGKTGDRSLRVDVNEYGAMGDAKWYHDPVSVNHGEWYEFSNYYRSDVLTTIAIQQFHENGNISFSILANASPSPDKWSRFSAPFYVQEGIEKVTVFHLIRNVGYLITDDFKLDLYEPEALSRALLTLTFDDGWQENYETALPIMEEYGIKSTQAYATKYINPSITEDINKIKSFTNAGHEIESHSVNHLQMIGLTDEEIWYELEESQKKLRNLFPDQEVSNFFSPFGVYNDKVLDLAHRLYDSHRATDVGFNSKDKFDVYNVRVQNILSTTTSSQIKVWIDEALKTKSWLVLVYHRVTDNPGYYDTYKNDFLNHVKTIKESGITVLTYSKALDEITSEK